MQDVQRRHSEQLDALNARCAELETANRKLRDIKYELDTKVCASCLTVVAQPWAAPLLAAFLLHVCRSGLGLLLTA
eukprot:scaffold225609_cov25-Tisochrysis_lutea.AAC.1